MRRWLIPLALALACNNTIAEPPKPDPIVGLFSFDTASFALHTGGLEWEIFPAASVFEIAIDSAGRFEGWGRLIVWSWVTDGVLFYKYQAPLFGDYSPGYTIPLRLKGHISRVDADHISLVNDTTYGAQTIEGWLWQQTFTVDGDSLFVNTEPLPNGDRFRFVLRKP